MSELADLGFISYAGLGIFPYPQYEGVPQVSFNNFAVGNNAVRYQPNNTWHAAENFSKIYGRHTLKFGGEFRYLQVNDRNLSSAVNGAYTFNGSDTGNDIADFLLGAPSGYVQSSIQFLDSRTKYGAVYAQDSFRIKSNLTLNYGLRWEASMPWYDTEDKIETLVPGVQSTQFLTAPKGWLVPGDPGIPWTLAPTDYKEFSSRLGIAYSPSTGGGILGKILGGPGESSIRAAYGIYYTAVEDLTLFDIVADAPYGQYWVAPQPVLMQEPFRTRSDGSSQFSFSPTLGGIFVDPVNSQRLYVARRFGQGCLDQNRVFIDCGLFKSADAGQTWQIVPIPGTTSSVAFDRTTGDIYAGASQPGNVETVIKSSDQGITWTPLVKGAGGTNDGPFVLADPGAAGNVYSLGDTGAFGGSLQKTTDGGATWKKVTVPPYCSGTAVTCPSGTSITPSVAGLAYVFAAPPLPPAVSVTGTVSAASLQPGPVAAESIVIATGSHIATGTATADIDQPPMTLAGTTVNVTDSAGVTRPAALFSVSATQVMYQIPPGTAAGTANVTITAGDGVTGTVQVQVAALAPGLYTLNAAGLVKAFVIRVSNGNQFVEDVYEIDPTGAVIARPITISNGDQVYLIAYGTGFRAAGSGGVAVTIGADIPPVLYAGPQDVAVGVDQFNILIPPDLAAGGPQLVPIVLTAGGQTANTVNVTVQ